MISLNKELTSIHQEVIENLESIHGALLCMNRSIHKYRNKRNRVALVA